MLHYTQPKDSIVIKGHTDKVRLYHQVTNISLRWHNTTTHSITTQWIPDSEPRYNQTRTASLATARPSLTVTLIMVKM